MPNVCCLNLPSAFFGIFLAPYSPVYFIYIHLFFKKIFDFCKVYYSYSTIEGKEPIKIIQPVLSCDVVGK